VVSECPKEYKNKTMTNKCESNTGALEIIPVFDHKTKKSYKNIYCAKCHNASDTAYWNIKIECKHFLPPTNYTFEELIGSHTKKC
jgi:hypothetical protein